MGNILVMGEPGSGLTSFVKKDIIDLNNSSNKIFVFDYYGEYHKFAERNNGQVIDVSKEEIGVHLFDKNNEDLDKINLAEETAILIRNVLKPLTEEEKTNFHVEYRDVISGVKKKKWFIKKYYSCFYDRYPSFYKKNKTDFYCPLVIYDFSNVDEKDRAAMTIICMTQLEKYIKSLDIKTRKYCIFDTYNGNVPSVFMNQFGIRARRYNLINMWLTNYYTSFNLGIKCNCNKFYIFRNNFHETIKIVEDLNMSDDLTDIILNLTDTPVIVDKLKG